MATAPADGVIAVPLLPLKNVVIFPSMIVPLYVGREKSVKALEEALLKDRRIFLCAQKSLECEEPGPDDIHRIGILGEIIQMMKLPDGTHKVLIEGVSRAVIDRFLNVRAFMEVEVVRLEEERSESVEIEALMRGVAELFERYVELNKKIPPEVTMAAQGVEDPGRLADIVATHLAVSMAEKQDILETTQLAARLEKLSSLLQKEIEILEIDRNIRRRVRQQIDRRQKEFYLKEQMRVIQEELGSEDEHFNEIDELRDKVRELKLTEAAQSRFLKEIDRLERMPPGSPEVSVVRNYIDLVLALPWNTRTEDSTDITAAEKILDQDHHGLAKIKERILEFLAVRQLTRSSKGPILCLVGPPGVGKTSLGQSIARALGRKFVRLSLGGVCDEAEIRGHRRTYVGSMPGRILQSMRYVGTKNPVFLLDEIDKVSSDFRGDPASALLEVLDPEQNKTFSDHYLEVAFDLSEVLFITTANVLYPIPRALRDRLEVLNLPGYTAEEKLEIGRQFLIPKQLKDHGILLSKVEFTEGAVKEMIDAYTGEAGVRDLERTVAAICRKVARSIVKGKRRKVTVTAARLEDFLGPRRHKPDQAHAEPLIGIANGLAWTEVGGVLMPIEVVTMPGKGQLHLTGQMGDIMQESAKAAMSYTRARAESLGLAPGFREKLDVHVHLPKGATPKDGPSAGISLGLAIVSALTHRKVRSDMALSGEITLRGRVLPVGGIKEKVLAAHRLGIRNVVLPAENKPDVVEIPAKVRRVVRIQYVESMDEVLELALLPAEGKVPTTVRRVLKRPVTEKYTAV
jgi:ATP-dependent Lon protease